MGDGLCYNGGTGHSVEPLANRLYFVIFYAVLACYRLDIPSNNSQKFNIKGLIVEMTDDQIESAVNKLRDAMREHRSKITSDVAQRALGVPNLGRMMFALFRECAEAVSNLIVRKVKVNRNRSPQEAIEATGFALYTDRKIVDAMPKGEGDEIEVVFFKPDPSNHNGRISDDNLEHEFGVRGLKPADPYTLAAVNEADPAFADERPHGTHWKDAEGNWCCAGFGCWRIRPEVRISRGGDGWDVGWWFAGVRT